MLALKLKLTPCRGTKRVGYEHPEYGVRFNFALPVEGDAGKYTRLGTLAEFNDENGHADDWSPEIAELCYIQEQMRRCVVFDYINNDPSTPIDPTKPQEAVNYYLDPINSNLREDGVTEAILDGSHGQVMVEIPKFYQRTEYDGEDTMEFWICQSKRSKYSLHPAFIKLVNGKETEVPYRYYGAYQAVLQDNQGNYLDMYDCFDDEGEPISSTELHLKTRHNTRNLSNQSSPRIASASNLLPVTTGYRSTYRAAARRRDGNNDDSTWRQLDWFLYSATQLLFLIEYASFNSQRMLTGTNDGGLTNTSSTIWGATNSNYPWVPTGGTNTIGNASGNVSLKSLYGDGKGLPVTDGENDLFWDDVIPSYRGIEMWYGHIWQFLDGINLEKYKGDGEGATDGDTMDISIAYGEFEDNTHERAYKRNKKGKMLDGIPNPGNHYPSRIYEDKALLGFWTKAGGGSSTTGLCDYHYSNFTEGFRVLLAGSRSNNGVPAGAFLLDSYYGSAFRDPRSGGRLCL